MGALTVVDNVFTTPIFSNALSLGADVVVYSATKHIDGQGRTLGGVILGSEDYIRNTVEPFMKHTGGSMSPFTGWVLLKGLETLDLRVQAQSDRFGDSKIFNWSRKHFFCDIPRFGNAPSIRFM